MSIHDHEAIFEGKGRTLNRLKNKFCHKCRIYFKAGDMLIVKPNGRKAYHKQCWDRLFL